MNKANKLLLLSGLAILGIWILGCATETEEVYTIYLPIIQAGPRPAMKGVGLSGSYDAIGRLGVDWYYTWDWQPPTKAPDPDRRFVPMIWGKVNHLHLTAAVATAMAGSGHLLLFNEPDQKSQANMTPEEGADQQHLVEQQAAGVKLVSPVPSQDNPDWLWQMVAVYERKFGRKPRFDAVAAHYYCFEGDWTDARDYLIRVRQQALAHGYDVPIWLTEWGGECWSPNNHNEEIVRGLIPWMRKQPWMGRYAWFASHLPDPPATEDLEFCSLTDVETGEPTRLGRLYRDL